LYLVVLQNHTGQQAHIFQNQNLIPMQRLTVAGRLIITALVVAAFYFGFSKLGGQELLKKFKTTDSTQTASTTSSTLPAEEIVRAKQVVIVTMRLPQRPKPLLTIQHLYRLLVSSKVW
jgi:hypothetical protein